MWKIAKVLLALLSPVRTSGQIRGKLVKCCTNETDSLAMYSLYISSVGCIRAFFLSSLQFVIILLLRIAHTQKHHCSCLLTCRQEICANIGIYSASHCNVEISDTLCDDNSPLTRVCHCTPKIWHRKHFTVECKPRSTVAIATKRKMKKQTNVWYLSRNINTQKCYLLGINTFEQWNWIPAARVPEKRLQWNEINETSVYFSMKRKRK